eukprot:Pompholyxophrys_punicea_v1_NODE_119_length_3359_cov_12.851998.p6 type:complete len:100 gc:universal NODE_119_length_3359_cov_12.851998:1915-1616(-)
MFVMFENGQRCPVVSLTTQVSYGVKSGGPRAKIVVVVVSIVIIIIVIDTPSTANGVRRRATILCFPLWAVWVGRIFLADDWYQNTAFVKSRTVRAASFR